MVIFHSYVNLPEGKLGKSPTVEDFPVPPWMVTELHPSKLHPKIDLFDPECS
jgi:hypothetical protein